MNPRLSGLISAPVAAPALEMRLSEGGQYWTKPASRTRPTPEKPGRNRYVEITPAGEKIIYFACEPIRARRIKGKTRGGYAEAQARRILHRENGPAVEKFWSDGSLRLQCWLRWGMLHREDGPAEVEYRRSGQLESESWYLRDQLHRDDGKAAVVFYNRGGKPGTRCWYLWGRKERQADLGV